MRIAIPIWEGKISPVLDTASRLLVLDTEDQSEASRLEIFFDEHDLSRRCFRIQALGVDTLICGAISRPFLRMLHASGISVVSGIAGHAEEVLDACLQGNLSQSRFLMPGFKRNGLRQNSRSLDLKKSGKKRPRRKGEGHGRHSEV